MAEPAEWLAGWSERLSRGGAVGGRSSRRRALGERPRQRARSHGRSRAGHAPRVGSPRARARERGGLTHARRAHGPRRFRPAGEELETARARPLRSVHVRAARELAEARISQTAGGSPAASSGWVSARPPSPRSFTDATTRRPPRGGRTRSRRVSPRWACARSTWRGTHRARTALRDALATFDIPITAPSAD